MHLHNVFSALVSLITVGHALADMGALRLTYNLTHLIPTARDLFYENFTLAEDRGLKIQQSHQQGKAEKHVL